MKHSPLQILRRQRGFTLVELMVVLVIIVVLASLGFVVFAKVRESAQTTVALSRIRNLGQANGMYASDHNGKYVPVFAFDEKGRAGVMWHFNPEFLEGIVGDEVFQNEPDKYEGMGGFPESVLDPVVVRAKKQYWDRISASFGYNEENTPGGAFESRSTLRRHTTTTMQTPIDSVMFITATDWIAKYGGRFLWERSPEEGKTPDGKIAYRHKGKAIVVYYDGHTGMITPEEMREIDRKGGINNVFWGGKRRN